MKKIIIILIILMLFFCKEVKESVKKENAETRTIPEEPAVRIKIAGFNIKIFEKAKASKPEVMDILVDMMGEFDIIAIQGIQDIVTIETLKNLLNFHNVCDYVYDYIFSEGRPRTKKKDAIIYNTDKIKVIYEDELEDDLNLYEREPYVACFEVKESDFNICIGTVSLNPDYVYEEIEAFKNDISLLTEKLNETEMILAVDVNEGGNNFDEEYFIDYFSASGYLMVIPDEENDPSLISGSTYCRLILTKKLEEEYSGDSGVYPMDEFFNLSFFKIDREELKKHFPVWIEIYAK